MNEKFFDGSLLKKDQPKPEKPLRNSGRRKPLPKASVKQKLREEYLRGVREGFIFLQNRLDPDGVRCWACGRKVRRLDLHHVRSRAQGGHDTPSNLELWCRQCHSVEHGVPRFGEGKESA